MTHSRLKSLQKLRRDFTLTHPFVEDAAIPLIVLVVILVSLPTLLGGEFGFRELDLLGYLLILVQLLALFFLCRAPLNAYVALQIGFQGYNA